MTSYIVRQNEELSVENNELREIRDKLLEALEEAEQALTDLLVAGDLRFSEHNEQRRGELITECLRAGLSDITTLAQMRGLRAVTTVSAAIREARQQRGV